MLSSAPAHGWRSDEVDGASVLAVVTHALAEVRDACERLSAADEAFRRECHQHERWSSGERLRSSDVQPGENIKFVQVSSWSGL